MIKRARRIPTQPGTNVESLVHECSVEPTNLRLRTWHRQRNDINRPGHGGAGENLFGEDLAPRLKGMLLRPVGDVTIAWDANTMRDGAVYYLSTCFDGQPAPLTYRWMEIGQMADLCPPALRQNALYPHWDHKQYVYITDFVNHIQGMSGIGIVPAVKVITDGDGTGGFTGPDVIIEVRLGPLGFVGSFDHSNPENAVDYRDARKFLPDGSVNPNRGYFTLPSTKPENWEFG